MRKKGKRKMNDMRKMCIKRKDAKKVKENKILKNINEWKINEITMKEKLWSKKKDEKSNNKINKRKNGERNTKKKDKRNSGKCASKMEGKEPWLK